MRSGAPLRSMGGTDHRREATEAMTRTYPSLLQGLEDEARRSLIAQSRPRRFRARDIVCHEGDPGDSLHVVVSGKLAVRVTTPLGQIATLSLLGPGDSFGELALLDPASLRTATVVAIEEAHTLTLTGAQLDVLRRQYPQVDTYITETLTSYVRRLSTMVLEALYLPVEDRVTRRLARLAGLYSLDNGGADIRLTQDDLASMAGTTRATANKVLQELAGRGLLTLRRGRISVPDRYALDRAAR
jgi:CRP/FNR family transcriptional regulator, cyclic AMP receptor protein